MSNTLKQRRLRAVPSSITLTRLTDVNNPLTKRYQLVADKIEKTTNAQLYEGTAQRLSLTSLTELNTLLTALNSNQALSFGVTKKASVSIVAKDKLSMYPDAIARTKEHFQFPKGPAVWFIDGDADYFLRPIKTAAEFHQALVTAEPALIDAPMLITASASAYIYNSVTGEELIGPRGWHCYIPVQSGEDIERAGGCLYERTWTKEYGSFLVSKNGMLLERSLIDQSVWQSNRLDFAAGAHCEPPLEQRRPPAYIVGDPTALFDSSRISALTVAERREVTEAKNRARSIKTPDAQRIRHKYVVTESKAIAKRTGCTEKKAAETVRRALDGGTLGSDFVLYPETGDPVTVREILADITGWHETRFADPIEPEYRDDRRIAYLNCAGKTGPELYSHAHGGRVFKLGDTDRDWLKLLRVAGVKKTRLLDEENVRLVLTHDPALKGIVKFDEFAGTMILATPIPGTDTNAKLPRPWTDTDSTALVQYIQRTSLPKISCEKIERAVAQFAQDVGKYHPVRDYLEALQWDEVERLNGWLEVYTGAHDAPPEYLQAVGAVTLIGGVARIYQPGCKNDCALVLEGAQGIKKSTVVCTLARRDVWFSDSLPADLATKDARDHLRGKWAIELPELAQFKRNEIETVKAFMSRRIEQYRPPYGRHEIQYPRQCFFIGSTNDSEYLVDTTGNRRFMPVKCKTIDIDGLLRDRDQLWAEAVHRYKAGEKWYLSAEIGKLAEIETASRVATDPWLPLVAAALPTPLSADQATRVTAGEILDHMQIDKSQRHPRAAARVSSILRELGCKREKRDGRRGWVFLLPPVQVLNSLDEWVEPILGPDDKWVAPDSLPDAVPKIARDTGLTSKVPPRRVRRPPPN